MHSGEQGATSTRKPAQRVMEKEDGIAARMLNEWREAAGGFPN